MPIAAADFIEGAARSLAVLESFDTERQRLNATLAAERAGITRAAARRHLMTLAHLGYLEEEGGYYWLAPRVLRLSGSYLASARLPRSAQPMLDRLAGAGLGVAAAFSVAVLGGDDVVVVARSVTPAGAAASDAGDATRPSRSLLAYGTHLGARLPAHATSTGRVLLAGLTRPALVRWVDARLLARLTPNTVVERGDFLRLVDRVRQDDSAWADETHEFGVSALAVPLRDSRGRLVAALNGVGRPADLADPRRRAVLLERLQEAAQALRPQL